MIRAGAAAALAALLLAGCGKPEAPKVDAASERAAATERAKKDAFGTQVQSLEKAQGMEADLNRKATESVDKIEAQSK